MIYILTFEYFDKSDFRVCGATDSHLAAVAWLQAGDGQHKVYEVKINAIADHSTGFTPMELK